MILRIEESDLRTHLTVHDLDIGRGQRAASVAGLFAGIFYVHTTLTIGTPWLRYTLLVLALAFTVWQACILYRIMKHPYNADKLLKDVEAMDRTERRSTIIAIRDATGELADRYLVYRDDGWGCDFFPNHRSAEPETADKQQSVQYLKNSFGLGADAFTIRHVGHQESSKPSTEHNNEIRYYDYQLYQADVKDLPESWKADSFKVGSKDCKWMTIEEMMRDPTIRKVNSDVVTLVRDHIS